ncbi:hypothetical protein Lser_V15G28758 [Lactuca serriola]
MVLMDEIAYSATVLLSDLSRQAHKNPSVNQTRTRQIALFSATQTKKKHSGLSRCGKSYRLRWANHLNPDLKKGAFTPEEERRIIELHAKMGNKWARMAIEITCGFWTTLADGLTQPK